MTQVLADITVRGPVIRTIGGVCLLENVFPASPGRLGSGPVAAFCCPTLGTSVNLLWMNCIVTAGPTFEPLDAVRRLTNSSTGRLGTEFANFLTDRGHQVRLLIGEQATWRGERRAQVVQSFTTTENLRERLQAVRGPQVDGVFHVAAVNDFACAKAWERSEAGEWREIRAAKLPSRLPSLLVELVPTPKVIGELRAWFPRALLVGWKLEMDGNPQSVLNKAAEQMTRNQTQACVVNGRGYGSGFGLVEPGGALLHLQNDAALFEALHARLLRHAGTPCGQAEG